MWTRALFWIIGVVVVLAVAVGVYVFDHSGTATPPGIPFVAPTNSQPNPSVAAGSITSVTATSITIKKQDGSLANFTIAQDATVLLAQNGQAAAAQTLQSLAVGMTVLITPAGNDGAVAKTILILPKTSVQ